MRSDPGYPDDIRSYDHVPGSPFYVGKDETEILYLCEECKDEEVEFTDMHYISPMEDNGLCNECAKNDHVRIIWMGE